MEKDIKLSASRLSLGTALKIAWRNLWRNRRRTLITSASISFAVLISVAMSALQEGVYEKMVENVVGFYTGYIQVHADGYWDEPILDNTFERDENIAQTILKVKGVEASSPRIESFALASSSELTEPCQVVGIDPEKEELLTGLQDKVVEGSYLKVNEAGSLLAKGLAEELELGVGDTLLLIGQGYHGVNAAGKYPIRGLLSFGSPELNKQMVYLSLDEAQDFYGAYQRLTSYALKVSNSRQVPGIVAAMKEQLPSEYEVLDWKEMMPELVQTIEGDKAGGAITMLVLYLIIGFGILGTVLMMMKERSYEFGVMTAIGMRKSNLARVLLLEVISMALLGVLVGAVLALPIVWYYHVNPIYLGDEMSQVYEQYGIEAVLPMSLNPQIFLNQVITVLIITFLMCIYPLTQVFRIDPVKAMRS